MTRHLTLTAAIVMNAAAMAAEPTSLATFVSLERPAPSLEMRYGAASAQVIDVFLPESSGVHPVAILIHGGCWSATTAGREQLRHLGAELARRGIAAWSIGYRRANEQGGGYPGTYEDVATALDRLRAEAGRFRLDLSRTVLVGHSAGGHLALWAAARDRLPRNSPLKTPHPFTPSRVISLAGVGDLKTFMPSVSAICGPEIAERLAGTASAERVDPYADTSPTALPAPAAQIVMLSGVLDRLVPPYVADDYARAMRARGKYSIELINIEGAGHFDLVTPGTTAWEEVLRRTEAAVGTVPAVESEG